MESEDMESEDMESDLMALLVDLHRRQDRQGPGGDAQTRTAMDLAGLWSQTGLRVADIGCGTGASAFVLAELPDVSITAVDLFDDFLTELTMRAHKRGLSDRLRTVAADMTDLPFGDEEFDVLWSEGAIYSMGFEAGVQSWRRYLKPGGVLAVSELTWLTRERPGSLEEYWIGEYPEIDTAAAKMAILEKHGYAPIGYFTLPRECWIDAYFAPLADEFARFLDRHDGNAAAESVVAAERAEIELFQTYGEFYSYGFYIARRTDAITSS